MNEDFFMERLDVKFNSRIRPFIKEALEIEEVKKLLARASQPNKKLFLFFAFSILYYMKYSMENEIYARVRVSTPLP